MKSLFKILAFIPLGIELLLLLIILPNKVGGILWTIHIPIVVLLAIVGVSIFSEKKLIQQSGIVSLVILTLLFCVMGYYDFIKWFSSIVGIVIFIYFAIIKIAIKKLKIV
ncbi:hypothetical protein [Clostridium sp.]|jgi:hypothetical protein|uniref:hypothetical protein n=1 Tax=Clostridium sp. TaxID=1506 RepID=UPI001DBCD8A6|nr:hypothetical protein [Clostridium sp.]MBS5305977.1 hypothetical protein [Clostridium sp.]MDU3526309.1 hypothetical protein [Clostridium sp.]MDU3547732.1 hypothetical protein [Clostridium sp.]